MRRWRISVELQERVKESMMTEELSDFGIGESAVVGYLFR